MPVLNLGVVEVAYEDEGRDAKKKKKPKRGEGSSSGTPTTTVTVAQSLEEKYGIMEIFYDRHVDEITGSLVSSLEGAIENLHLGAPIGDPYAEAGQDISSAFRVFLMTGEIETLGIEGIPTQAALDRKSLRFKSGQSDKPRPSFIDTSLYENSMRAWVDT